MARNKYLYIALFWTALMLYLCLREMEDLPKITIPGKDKIAHFAFYSGFVIFWFKAIQKNINIILIIGVLLGILIEFLQLYCTKTRSFDVFDILANTCGALFAYFYIIKFLPQKND